jgi:ABC-2 type transport system ATP-binding protein
MLATEEQSNNSALVIRGLRKSFGDVIAVNGLNLEVKRGECFGLLGPNGAGKTTTIEICEGLTSLDAGTVQMLGQNWREHADELRQRIGVQLQETQFPEKLTVEETISLFHSSMRNGSRGSAVFRAVRSKGLRWLALWSGIQNCYFLTNPQRDLIRRREEICGT